METTNKRIEQTDVATIILKALKRNTLTTFDILALPLLKYQDSSSIHAVIDELTDHKLISSVQGNKLFYSMTPHGEGLMRNSGWDYKKVVDNRIPSLFDSTKKQFLNKKIFLWMIVLPCILIGGLLRFIYENPFHKECAALSVSITKPYFIVPHLRPDRLKTIDPKKENRVKPEVKQAINIKGTINIGFYDTRKKEWGECYLDPMVRIPANARPGVYELVVGQNLLADNGKIKPLKKGSRLSVSSSFPSDTTEYLVTYRAHVTFNPSDQ